jgi:hypothetical protein
MIGPEAESISALEVPTLLKVARPINALFFQRHFVDRVGGNSKLKTQKSKLRTFCVAIAGLLI